jgi:hypothetical protein
MPLRFELRAAGRERRLLVDGRAAALGARAFDVLVLAKRQAVVDRRR